MLPFLIGTAIGGFLVFVFFRKDTNVLPSRYDRMSSAALHDLYKDYETEMTFWVKVLTIDIQSVGLADKSGYNWFSSGIVIMKLKKLAVWRIDALEDIMEGIKASMYANTGNYKVVNVSEDSFAIKDERAV